MKVKLIVFTVLLFGTCFWVFIAQIELPKTHTLTMNDFLGRSSQKRPQNGPKTGVFDAILTRFTKKFTLVRGKIFLFWVVLDCFDLVLN